jgi:hypothetical protein
MKRTLLISSVFFLSGCGYHFSTQVDAYDLLERPVANKTVAVIPPDDSIQSRYLASMISDGLIKGGFRVNAHDSMFTLLFNYSDRRENVIVESVPVTGVIGYVVDNKSTSKTANGKTHTNYSYQPVEGVIGVNEQQKSYFFRSMTVRIQTKGTPGKDIVKIDMQSNAPVQSDQQAYSAMVAAVLSKIDSPLRSGNYVAVVPWN